MLRIRDNQLHHPARSMFSVIFIKYIAILYGRNEPLSAEEQLWCRFSVVDATVQVVLVIMVVTLKISFLIHSQCQKSTPAPNPTLAPKHLLYLLPLLERPFSINKPIIFTFPLLFPPSTAIYFSPSHVPSIYSTNHPQLFFFHLHYPPSTHLSASQRTLDRDDF